MALFSSRSPYDIVRTPEDDALIQNGDFREEEVYGLIPEKFYNPTNPILALFRTDLADSEEGADTLAKSWARFLAEGRPAFTLRRGKRVVEHAHKVLTRLANLAKES